MAENVAENAQTLRGKGYFRESLEELRKVQTPTREETMRNTWVVLMIIVFISLALFVVDMTFHKIMSLLIS